ncbi:MAG: CatB-related O-acetyltransferase [Lachnospiraceae bacterium]|nr:CatB-related O-acetyltransferase [Lachnospiraceae bacterium]
MFGSIRKRLDNRRINREGGQKTSALARKKARERKVEIGMHSYGSCFDPGFNVGGTVTIGRYCSFGPNVRYFGGNHPMQYATMTPYFYRKEWGYDVKDIPRQELTVGHDVWVGYGTIITSSCKSIGNGAVIGAGSIVTKDVPPYAIVMGVPARITGYRFPEETQKKLEESKWWDKEPDELIKFYGIIDQPEKWAEEIMKNAGRE